MKVLISLLTMMLSVTFACSCLFADKPLDELVTDAYNAADVVFVGRVVASSITQVPLEAYGNEKYPFYIAVFKVNERFKHAETPYIITIADVFNLCSYGARMGRTYLIYGYGNKEEGYQLGSCSRSRELSDQYDGEDLPILRNLIGLRTRDTSNKLETR